MGNAGHYTENMGHHQNTGSSNYRHRRERRIQGQWFRLDL